MVGALGIKPVYIGMSAEDVLFEAADEEAVRSIKPDFATLRSLPARGVIVTSRSSDKRFDFVSRFFAPAVGVDEDPVTGSSHTVLVPYWAGRLGERRSRPTRLRRAGVSSISVSTATGSGSPAAR